LSCLFQSNRAEPEEVLSEEFLQLVRDLLKNQVLVGKVISTVKTMEEDKVMRHFALNMFFESNELRGVQMEALACLLVFHCFFL